MNDSTQAAPAAPRPAPRPAPPRPGPDAPPALVPELAELDTLADRPLAEHVTVLDTVHRALAAQLSAAES